MSYADFAFYQDEFCGSLIPTEDDYKTASVKAKCYLDWLTNGQIKDLEDISDDIKLAECAVSEVYWINGRNPGILSEGNDGYQVEFAEPQEMDLYRTAVRFLPDGLIYRGIGI